MQDSTWKENEVFPIIARLIHEAHQRHRGYVSAYEIAEDLLEDGEARVLIANANQIRQDWSQEHLATDMVAWFSQRITVSDSEWHHVFERKEIDGQWAYRPAPQTTGSQPC